VGQAQSKPASPVRDGQWLIGMGVASAIRNNLMMPSAPACALDADGIVTVETDMTDIGTGSYTDHRPDRGRDDGRALDRSWCRLGTPVSRPSAARRSGAPTATAGVYAACVKLRDEVAARSASTPPTSSFSDGKVRSGGP
jgi:xanthine dehydrogenase YagR molybdenum-binding subunit